MNLDHQATTITLDWDDITKNEFEKRIAGIRNQSETTAIFTRQSANSGYHIKVEFRKPIQVLPLRRKFRDDGRRIINDILNRPAHIHDILWDEKITDGNIASATQWEKRK